MPSNPKLNSQQALTVTLPVNAAYESSPIEHYRGNPLIEALPPIRDAKFWRKMFTNLPVEPDPIELAVSPEIKMHAILRVKKIFVPFPRHLELQERMDIVLRQAYVGKIISGPQRQVALQKLYEAVQKGKIPESIEPEVAGETFSLVGCSGLGKTWAITRYTQHLPQLIWHPQYQVLQIPILMVECPHSGSTLDLAKEILAAIDKLIGTTYGAESKRLSEEQILLSAAHKFEMYCVGLLILDEIQNVSVKKSQGREDFNNFFLKLLNVAKCSVLVIGTMKAIKVLQTDFRQARRLSSMGTLYWDRMPEESGDWKRLVKTLWDYQWTLPHAELTEEIQVVLYEHSQGITSLLVRLFILAQIRAARIGKPLTAELLRQVANDNFKMLDPFIKALRSGDPRQIAKYEDLKIPDIEELIELSGAGSRQALLDSESEGGLARWNADARTSAINSLNSLNMPLQIAVQTVDDILARNAQLDASTIVITALNQVHGKARQRSHSRLKVASTVAEDPGANESGYAQFAAEGLIRSPEVLPDSSNGDPGDVTTD